MNTATNQPGQIYQVESRSSLLGVIKTIIYSNLFSVLLVVVYMISLRFHRYTVYDFAAIIIATFLYMITILGVATSALLTHRIVIHILNIIIATILVYLKCIGYVIFITHNLPNNFDPLTLYNQVSQLANTHPLRLYTAYTKGNELVITWGIESIVMS